MSTRSHAPAKAAPASAFTPASTGALQRKCACGSKSGLDGACPDCRSARLTGRRPGTGGRSVPRDLTINEPGDKFEAEADRIADTVLRRPAGSPQLPQKRRADEPQSRTTEPLVQRLNSAAEGTSQAPPIVHDELRSPGTRLDASVRHQMEPRFGHDFAQVRIHSGAHAAESAQAVNARAYTVGNQIVFAKGQYAPATQQGQRLLAHELTHVVQQSQSPQPNQVQRIDWGPFGGKCCNESPEGDEWALVGSGTWQRLSRTQCTGTTTDCDGMTCGGGFYYVSNLAGGVCRTPRQDDATYRNRRWTPTKQASDARSPTFRGSQAGDTPPGYDYYDAFVTSPGTVAHSGSVGASSGVPVGSVEVRTGEDVEIVGSGSIPNVLAIEYTGALTADSKWLQFVWFEMNATTPGGVVPVAGTIPTSSGNLPFTTTPASPNWAVDSGPTDPFYESGALNIRTQSSTAIFDAPGGSSAAPLAASVFTGGVGATSVVFTAHFETYLIQNDTASYRVSWSASTAFTLAGAAMTVGAIGYTVGASGDVTGLPANLKSILHTNYTAHTHIQ